MTDENEFVDENDNKVDDREEATLGMSEINDFDFDRAVMLMSVMEKVANVAPKASAISGLAAAALNEMNEEAKAIAKRRAEEFAKLEAQRAEALAAQQREQAKVEAEEAEAAKDKKAAAIEAAKPRAVPAASFQSQPRARSTDDTNPNGRRI